VRFQLIDAGSPVPRGRESSSGKEAFGTNVYFLHRSIAFRDRVSGDLIKNQLAGACDSEIFSGRPDW
jgi:hypothetical protein